MGYTGSAGCGASHPGAVHVGDAVYLSWRSGAEPGSVEGEDVWLMAVTTTLDGGGNLVLTGTEARELPRWPGLHSKGDQRLPALAALPDWPEGHWLGTLALAAAWVDYGGQFGEEQGNPEFIVQLSPTPIHRRERHQDCVEDGGELECGVGEGRCDPSGGIGGDGCADTLICRSDAGPNYGWGLNFPVCVPPSCVHDGMMVCGGGTGQCGLCHCPDGIAAGAVAHATGDAFAILDSDNRTSIDHLKGQYPWNNHGQMYGAGTCTAFKMVNHYTAVTAAHCVHNGSSFKSRHHITFGDLPSLGWACYIRAVPACWDGDTASCDYAVIALRGRNGANCAPSTYNVGYLGWSPVGSWVEDIKAFVSGYPSEDLKAGWAYPVLVYHYRSDGYAIGTYPDRVFFGLFVGIRAVVSARSAPQERGGVSHVVGRRGAHRGRQPARVSSPRPYPIHRGVPVSRLLTMVTNFSERRCRRPSHFSSTPICCRTSGGRVASHRAIAHTSARRTVCQLRPYLVAT